MVVDGDGDRQTRFARRFPLEWRRTALVPGLRQQVLRALASPVDTPERTIEPTGYLLGYGRALTDATPFAALQDTADAPASMSSVD